MTKSEKFVSNIPPETSVLFVTFSMWADGKRRPTNGNLEPLRNFLIPRVKRLILIDQEVPGSDEVLPKIEEYRNNQPAPVEHFSSKWFNILLPWLKAANKHGTRVSFKIRDFLSVFDWIIRDRQHYDYFIGLESINALAGIILRRFGIVSTVIYYVLDYSPTRYPNRLFNKVYLSLDIFCASHANFIWDVSSAMQPARIKAGLDPQKSAKVIRVPIGLYPEQIKITKNSDISPFSLVYMGTLGQDNGPDLAIDCLPLVLKKYPKTILHIIGGGKTNLDRLKVLIDSLHLGDKVILHGFVDTEKMTEIIGKCYIALAPYRSIPGSIRYFADASKIRTYVGAGVPVISSDVPPLGRELGDYGAAMVVKDSETDFANAIMSLFSNEVWHSKLRAQAIKFGKDNTWDNEFSKAFAKMYA